MTVTSTRVRRSSSRHSGAGTPTPPRLDSNWEIKDHIKVNGRNVERGVEVKIAGHSGRFVFQRYVHNPANGAEWIDVYGGPKGAETIRSFRPSKITTVHRTRKARP